MSVSDEACQQGDQPEAPPQPSDSTESATETPLQESTNENNAPRLDTAENNPFMDPSISWIADGPTELGQLGYSNLFELNQSAMDAALDDEHTRPLISDIQPMTVLRSEYERGNSVFVQQIDWLTSQGYTGVRRARGDGDCFYRSLAFNYISRLLKAPDPSLSVTRVISHLETTPAILQSVGFQDLVFEDFFETFSGIIKNIIAPVYGSGQPTVLTLNKLLEAFNDPGTSNEIVVYLRLLTSAQIRSDPESYEPFLFHPETGEPMSPRDFCENFVEAIGKEADHVQITALSKALKVNITLAYLDGHGKPVPGSGNLSNVEFVQFENSEGESQEERIEGIKLLYRPGHYDILESR